MCTTCGCGEGETTIDGEAMHAHGHWHADGTWHTHAHEHDHAHDHDHAHEHADGAHSHAPGVPASRRVAVETDILAMNDACAARNRQHFMRTATLALNLVSSPGSGTTALLPRTLDSLKDATALAVIEGDQATRFDADRIRATQVPALQINTGKGCHLDARMVEHALEKLPPPAGGILFIENVGNLVCPAAFDLGEAAKVVILSVTEGADKPLKYPDMFRAARLALINKIDLLPHVDFDVEQASRHALQVNPGLRILALSATTGEGFDLWLAWLRERLGEIKEARIRELEAQLAQLKG
ncbi:MAG: hydrogenase nickel incorporation protein HypB [Zoogloeaceae bacterium]|jgi:hydrogenase nickel incorporation protein HypB|nr:hydrogenase nickel incorporation protein HypB [Zoogloeaceae bacterium]